MDIRVKIDSARVDRAFAAARKTMERTLERYLGRAAQEVAREEKSQAPKAFSTLVNSIRAEKAGYLHYRVAPGVNYARAVEEGRPAGSMPGTKNGLMEWVKLRTGLQGSGLERAAFLIARAIGKRGIPPNPFVARTRENMESRVIDLVREGVNQGLKEILG